jgi:hypothetical protein
MRPLELNRVASRSEIIVVVTMMFLALSATSTRHTGRVVFATSGDGPQA